MYVSRAAAAARMVPRWAQALRLQPFPPVSLRTAKPGRSGHYWIRFTSVEIKNQRLNLRSRVLEPVNNGPEPALQVTRLLIPFSSRDPWRRAVQQTFMEGLVWVRCRAGCGVQTCFLALFFGGCNLNPSVWPQGSQSYPTALPQTCVRHPGTCAGLEGSHT